MSNSLADRAPYPALPTEVFVRLTDESSQLAARLRALAAARADLAALETREVARQVRSLGGHLALAAWLLLSTLPVLVVALATWISQWLGISAAACQATGCLLLVSLGLAIVAASWRRFRREFVGWEESLAELKEDLVWLREWRGAANRETPPKPDTPAQPSAANADEL